MALRWRWRWRAAPAGDTWWRRSAPRGSRRTWPSPPRPRRPGAARSGPRTDRSDSRLQRELLVKGELPESWIPPYGVLEWRERTRLYKTLVDERRRWGQRVHAELFQHGVALPEGAIRAEQTRASLAGDTVQLSPAARQRIAVGYRVIDGLEAEIVPLRRQLHRFVARQPACRALADSHFGIGPLSALVVWAELGDCRRFSRSMQAVRHTGLDITVHESNGCRPGGFLSREGPAILRWALFEAGKCAARANSPDYDYYQAVKRRQDGKLAAIAVARKLARRCYHTLRTMDPEVVYAMPEV